MQNKRGTSVTAHIDAMKMLAADVKNIHPQKDQHIALSLFFSREELFSSP
jgi:hypothetical protein